MSIRRTSRITHLTVFLISLWCILLELFLTRVLNLKAWNHVVYTVIPFAMLGYGIGANLQLLLKRRLMSKKPFLIIGGMLLLLALIAPLCTFIIILLPIKVAYVINIFISLNAVLILLAAYTIFMIPFVIIGFTIVYIFSNHPEENYRLYFFDLLGAGFGALFFFPLINHLAIFHSVVLLSCLGVIVSIWAVFPQKKYLVVALLVGFSLMLAFLHPEPSEYVVDPQKGWEWIPGTFPAESYEHILSQWHPLGRTDGYRFTNQDIREYLMKKFIVTFDINVIPPPEFAYFATNFLAGTPVYKFNEQGFAEYHSKIQQFSTGIEAPYALLKNPRVVIIGTGGGRDIFIAGSHEAKKILGAEINPAIFQAMSPDGALYEYSGKVYTMKNAVVYNVDGRQLVKTLPPNSVDLIVLNGVDTLSGLSSGAYAFAESYLYTKNAVMDYLKILNGNGMINFNRWLFRDMPRETLRLETIALDALKTLGVEHPEEHLIIGDYYSWSILLVKKTPFTHREKTTLFEYFNTHNTLRLYPLTNLTDIPYPLNMFQAYANDFVQGNTLAWEYEYPYDISVITDDNPFFYKYYKLSSFNPFKTQVFHHTGTIIFMTQGLVLLQAIIFIALFIFLPLYLFKKRDIQIVPAKWLFILFFSCLGVGFMFIEIPLMQRFVLLLGTPIHAITVVLSVLLISVGVGSFCLRKLQRLNSSKSSILTVSSVLIAFYLFLLIAFGAALSDYFIDVALAGRVMVVSLILFPLGFLLGLFFPSGLHLVSKQYPEAIAWAWGINSGCSVLGSILAIVFAQFSGFNTILLLAIAIYLIGVLSFRRLEHALSS